MSTGFKEALEREISDLEKSLETDPRFIKLRELQRVASLYTPGVNPVDGLKAFVNMLTVGNPPRAHAGGGLPAGIGSKHAMFAGGGEAMPLVDGQRRMQAITRQRVLEDAENILRGRSDPTKTADLYDDLVAAGHEIGGDDPKNNLSAMLSKSPLFRSHKRAGWTLVESQSTAPDDDSDEPDDQQQGAPEEQEASADDLLG
jgi:hypothetical protein